ncbi:MAG: amidase [Acidobacteria bacterium]|nr:MAG: amidase [Acidobacteriota bacterium]
MPRLAEIALLDATAQAELVRKKEVQPLELVEAAIERIERVNPRLNAVVTPMFDEARKAAREHIPDGPFRGVPFLLKDLLAAYAGVPMSWGSGLLRFYIPDHDSELVRRYKKAGLIVVGKTNTPEFGILPTTEPRLFGAARNPWNLERITGGSSGGSAAAVAAGMVAIAHGNDGGGSIRIPASCCGLFGLKPTRARNPLGPDIGDIMGGLVAEHALTRSVRDSAALLDATAGPDIGDPYWAPPPARRFAEEVGRDPGRLRVAFTAKAPTCVPIHPECVKAVREAANLCADLGHEVEEDFPKINGNIFTKSFMDVWASGSGSMLDTIEKLGLKVERESIEPLSWALYEKGKKVTGPEYLVAQSALQSMAREVARFMQKFDILLTPTLAEPPLPLGWFEQPRDNPLRALDRAAAFVPFTPIANATGQPAMSVPLYWTADGLPVGTHFIARFGDEATLFRLAAQLEAARPWKDRRQPVSAF